jgi:hypothetical protein
MKVDTTSQIRSWRDLHLHNLILVKYVIFEPNCNTNYKRYKDDRYLLMYTRQYNTSFLSNIMISLLFVILSFNIAAVSPSTYALTSTGQSSDQGTRHIFARGELYIKQTCEHAGGMYEDKESHYTCTFIDHVR